MAWNPETNIRGPVGPQGPPGPPGSSTGDVEGPASAVDGNIAVFDGATGKVIKDGGTNVSDLVTETEMTMALEDYPTETDLATILEDYPTETELTAILTGYATDTELTTGLSGKQPLDGDLTAIAGLTGTGALQKTGPDTWVLGTVGSSVTISDTPPASPSHGNLWWESDTGLLFIYYNDGSSSQWVMAVPIPDVSALGANPTATIGLTAVNGSAGTYLRSDGAPALSQAIVPTWTGKHTFNAQTDFEGQAVAPLQTLTDGTTISTWDCAQGQKAKVTLGGAGRVMSAVSNPVEGATYFLWVLQDATGSRTISWTTSGAGSFDFGASGTPTLTTTASRADLLTFEAVGIASTLKLRFTGIAKGFS